MSETDKVVRDVLMELDEGDEVHAAQIFDRVRKNVRDEDPVKLFNVIMHTLRARHESLGGGYFRLR